MNCMISTLIFFFLTSFIPLFHLFPFLAIPPFLSCVSPFLLSFFGPQFPIWDPMDWSLYQCNGPGLASPEGWVYLEFHIFIISSLRCTPFSHSFGISVIHFSGLPGVGAQFHKCVILCESPEPSGMQFYTHATHIYIFPSHFFTLSHFLPYMKFFQPPCWIP